MPIGRGIMIMDRLNIYPTESSIILVAPGGPQPCGTSVNFIGKVVNTRTTDFPTGNVSLIDENNVVVGTSTLSNSTPAGTSITGTMNLTITAGNHTYTLAYQGVHNQFAPSTSSPYPYSGTFINTLMSFPSLDLAPPPKFCYARPFNVTVKVQPVTGIIDPTGSVNFKLYSNNTVSVNLPSAPLVGQFATVTIPAFTTDSFISNVGTFYVQALYPGDSCFNSNQTAPGINIFSDIEAVSNVATTTTIISPSDGYTLPITSPFACGITVTSTLLSNPNSDGYVNLTGVKGLSNIFLGTDIPVSGNANIIVPASTFTSTGTWTVTANYFGDGYCYASSVSSSISIIVT